MKKGFVAIIAVLIGMMVSAQEIKKIKITDLEKTIAEAKTPLIVNFWATFCVPCIEEIPYFQEEVKKHAADSVQLILVSLDLPDDYAKIAPFATRRKFTATIVWLNETNADYFCPKVDRKWSGAIPSSLFINNKTGYRKFYEEQLSHEKLKTEMTSLIGK
jgi:thiol-disulfide isomerase/thioredoxin